MNSNCANWSCEFMRALRISLTNLVIPARRQTYDFVIRLDRFVTPGGAPLVGEGGFAKRRRVSGLYPRMHTPNTSRTFVRATFARKGRRKKGAVQMLSQ